MRLPERLQWAVAMLDVQPDDRILEIGCGTGAALAAVCERLEGGRVVGLDRSGHAVAGAVKRNAAAIEAGRADVRLTSLADADFGAERFDKAFAVRVNVFWLGPDRELTVLREALAPGGTFYLFLDPPSEKALDGALKRVRGHLTRGGWTITREVREGTRLCLCAAVAE